MMSWILLFFLTGGIGGATLEAAEKRGHEDDVLDQVSTLNALVEGDYDGRVRFRDLSARGDFGLGTFDRLDGEMVALDGKFFQVRADGVATRVRPNQTTPFAAVTFFQPDEAFRVETVTSCEDLRGIIERRFPSEELLYAVKVSGTFAALKTRSVPAQERPYVPLEEALRDQVVFDFFFVEATMVGFWLPAVLSNVNAAGFHFHALTHQGTAGGHVLDCEASNVKVEIDRTDELRVRFGSSRARRRSRR